MEDSVEKWLNTRRSEDEDASVCKPDDIVGNWKILALLGKGGSAEVYRVEHVRSKQIGALKLLCRQEEISRKRFVQERDLLRKQGVSCFAKFIDSGENDGMPFFVMEELQSFELPHRDPDVTRFIIDVCKAVHTLHSEGYVHRDLKPSNIMRRADGSYVLIDLGLVKKITTHVSTEFTDKSLSIVDGGREVVGTPGPSAPEQFISGKATEASDVHSIGMLIKKCFEDNPPPNWLHLIERATSSDDALRYQSIEELIPAVMVSSAIRPKAVLIAEVLSAIGLVFWGFCFSLLTIGMALGKISYETSQRNILVLSLFISIVVWLSLVEFGIRRRKNLARLYIIIIGMASFLIMLGVCFSVEIGMSFWLVAILFMVSRIIPGILFLLPKVRRWFKVSDR